MTAAEVRLPVLRVKAPRDLKSLLPRAYPQPASAEAQSIEREVYEYTAELYKKNASGLARYALAVSGNAEIAQEAVQEAFLRYYVTRRQDRAIHDGRSWLYRTTRNLVLDRLKEYSFRNWSSLGAASRLIEESQDPEAPLMQREITAQVLKGLSPRELECLRLRQDGLHYKEIARVLDIDTGTVGALLARGLKKIRAALSPGRESR